MVRRRLLLIDDAPDKPGGSHCAARRQIRRAKRKRDSAQPQEEGIILFSHQFVVQRSRADSAEWVRDFLQLVAAVRAERKCSKVSQRLRLRRYYELRRRRRQNKDKTFQRFVRLMCEYGKVGTVKIRYQIAATVLLTLTIGAIDVLALDMSS